MWYNTQKVLETPFLESLDYPKYNYKYADVDKIYKEQNNFVKKFIDTCPLSSGYKRTLIDIKVQNIPANFHTCIPGWHVDAEFEDTLHLAVFNGPTTEFMIDEVWSSNPVKKISYDKAGYFAIKPFTINTYSGTNFHRGPLVEEPCKRLLLRICQTNTIKPRNEHVVFYR